MERERQPTQNGRRRRHSRPGVRIHRVLIPRQPSRRRPRPTQWSPSGEPGCEGVSFAEQHGSGFRGDPSLGLGLLDAVGTGVSGGGAWSRGLVRAGGRSARPFGEGDSAGTGFFGGGGPLRRRRAGSTLCSRRAQSRAAPRRSGNSSRASTARCCTATTGMIHAREGNAITLIGCGPAPGNRRRQPGRQRGRQRRRRAEPTAARNLSARGAA